MKTAFVLLLSVAAISCAADKPAEQKRLQSVTWDLTSHKLVWVVQHGTEQNGQFVAAGAADQYEISPDDAVMSFANEKRGFTNQEAESLHKLLDTLSIYCAESVIWWDQGQGDKLDEPDAPKGEKVDTPKGKHANPPAMQSVLVASRGN